MWPTRSATAVCVPWRTGGWSTTCSSSETSRPSSASSRHCERLAETRERYVTWILTVLRANRAHLEGRLGDCEALARDAVAHGFGGHDESANKKLVTQMLFVRREQGRLGELVDAVERSAIQCPEIADWRCSLAYIHARLGRTAEARQTLDALARANLSDLLRDASWLPNLAMLSEVAVLLGDVPRARLLYTLLSPYAGRCVVNFALLCQGSAARPLGLLATTLSRYDDAERHFERAIATNTRIGSRLWVAHTRHDWAHMLLLRDRPGDAARALELLQQALAAAEELELLALAGDARRCCLRFVPMPRAATGEHRILALATAPV